MSMLHGALVDIADLHTPYYESESDPGSGNAGKYWIKLSTGVIKRRKDDDSGWDTVGFQNPMTTQDDVIIGGASGAATRLAKGTDGQVLTVDPVTHHLVWATPAAGYSDPLTTNGDLVVRLGGATTRLAKGSDTQVLTIDPTTHLPVWSTPFIDPMTTNGDIIVRLGGAASRLAKGSDSQVLTIDPVTHLPVWSTPAAGFADPMTTAGDIIIRNGSNATARLAKGSDGDVLTISASTHIPVWAAPAGGGGGGTVARGSYASRGSAGTAGKIYLVTDAPLWCYDDGSTWHNYHGMDEVTDPNLQTWAWVNQGTSTITAGNGMEYLLPQVSGTVNFRIRKHAAPATPYTVVAKIIPRGGTVARYGICFRESSSGKLHAISIGGAILYSAKYTNETTFSAVYTNFTVREGINSPMYPVWLRLIDDGTNRKVGWSSDGVNFIDYTSVGRTDFLTANEIGFFVDINGDTFQPAATLVSWKVS